MSNIKAVILAAGRSKRMLPLTKDFPKCLLPFGEKTILEYQLDLLKENRITDIIIVHGFAAHKVEKVAGEDITYIYNKEYLTTNSIYSLYLARDFMNSDIVLLNSDILVNRKLMKMLVEEEFPNAILVDFRKELLDGEMNVKVSEGFVTEIGKDIPANMADGESVQLCKLSKISAEILKDEVTGMIDEQRLDVFPSNALKPIIERYGLKAVDTRGIRWFEIDTPDDYKAGCSEFHE